ncbi:unnamed protein product [Phytophthora fragariaefolia]|uniref:Unnamed protein product n=1 Tax=Phytophthora fragariaefolia TaxID=1490495 RepID=A0A9W6Y180_9STRA|nr:unnamed protein product [Phytophthora fragariaefolia]
MASPSSPVVRAQSRSLTPDAAVNISSKLRRNSLVSDPEDMVLLREKLTRIAVGRHPRGPRAEEEGEERRRRRSSGAVPEHFKVFPLLPPERPSTPPSSPQPRDVLRKQLRLKQRSAATRREDDAVLDAMMSVDDVEISPMEDVEDNAVHSPPASARGRKTSPQARLSIPGHLRVMSSFSVLNKYPEGLRKRKSVHVDAADEDDEPRVSLKKTSSQINNLATAASKLSRSSSASGDLFQTFAARQRREQDQEMEDAGCTTQPQSPQNALFGGKQGRLSACS